MSTDAVHQPANLHAEVIALHERIERLQAENARLRSENRGLRCSLDALVARARSTAHFGPLELSAGTCVGPRGSLSDPAEPGVHASRRQRKWS